MTKKQVKLFNFKSQNLNRFMRQAVHLILSLHKNNTIDN